MAYNDLARLKLDLGGNILAVVVRLEDAVFGAGHGGFLSLVLSAGCRGVQSEVQMPSDIIAGYLGMSNNG